MNSGYLEKYNTFEWRLMRLLVLERDGNKCTKCGSVNRLQAHHTVYNKELLPWEYPTDDLVTLCNKCHELFHDETASCELFSKKVKKDSTINKIVSTLKKDFFLERIVDKKLFKQKQVTSFAKQVIGIQARGLMVEKYKPEGLRKMSEKEYNTILEETIQTLLK